MRTQNANMQAMCPNTGRGDHGADVRNSQQDGHFASFCPKRHGKKLGQLDIPKVDFFVRTVFCFLKLHESIFEGVGCPLVEESLLSCFQWLTDAEQLDEAAVWVMFKEMN